VTASPEPDPPRPVLYLDLDDTIVTWESGAPRGAPGVESFLRWALRRFEVRWLTSWAPDGQMEESLIVDLCRLTGVEVSALQRIRGLDWEGGSKLDGLAWLEHVALRRPFVWIEDSSLPDEAIAFLERHGFGSCFWRCDVTREADALGRLHEGLRAAWGDV
jgi:hypothetical protein